MLDEIQHRARVELARDHALGAREEIAQSPARAADVRHGHRHQRDIIGRPVRPGNAFALADLGADGQVAVRQHRPLGPPGGARGVQLQHHVMRRRPVCRRRGRLRVAPAGVARRIAAVGARFHQHHLAHHRQCRQQRLCHRRRFRPDEQHHRVAMADDELDLRRRQAPAGRRGDDAGLGRAEQQFEVVVAVLADIGNAVAGVDTLGQQRLRDPVGIALEVGVGGLAALERIRHRVGPQPGEMAHGVRQRAQVAEIHPRLRVDSIQAASLSAAPSGWHRPAARIRR
ncbi:hypothetical protein D9M69_472770 [compost metagenome]